jgi:hypothetical protein
VVLIPRTVVGVGIQDQFGIRHVLNEMQRIHGVNNDVVVSAHDQGGLFDILEISETLAAGSSPISDGRELCRRYLIADRSVAILEAVPFLVEM